MSKSNVESNSKPVNHAKLRTSAPTLAELDQLQSIPADTRVKLKETLDNYHDNRMKAGAQEMSKGVLEDLHKIVEQAKLQQIAQNPEFEKLSNKLINEIVGGLDGQKNQTPQLPEKPQTGKGG